MELALELGPMREGDAADVARLAGQLGYPSTRDDVLTRFGQISERPDQAVLVARTAQGQCVGWLHLGLRMSLASPLRLELFGLVVDEAARGQGVGTWLIRAAEGWAAARGAAGIRFTSQVKREDAHRLYRRLGYEVTKTSHVFEKRFAPK